MSNNLPAWLTPTQIRAFGLRPVPTTRPASPLELTISRTRSNAQKRRDRLMAAKRCINGWRHGPATDGTRCKACADKRRVGGGS